MSNDDGLCQCPLCGRMHRRMPFTMPVALEDVYAPLARLRANGWTVAVHNDYRQDGVHHTFWLMTKGDKAAKGEGTSDHDALCKAEREAKRIEDDAKHVSSLLNQGSERIRELMNERDAAKDENVTLREALNQAQGRWT